MASQQCTDRRIDVNHAEYAGLRENADAQICALVCDTYCPRWRSRVWCGRIRRCGLRIHGWSSLISRADVPDDFRKPENVGLDPGKYCWAGFVIQVLLLF